MADYSLGYGGVGSGMDITGMVEQLVAADRKPADNRLNRIESQAKFKLSAIGTVMVVAHIAMRATGIA